MIVYFHRLLFQACLQRREKRNKLVCFIVGSDLLCSTSKSEHMLCKGENLEIPENDFSTVLEARELENLFSSPYMIIFISSSKESHNYLITLSCMSN